LKALLLAGGHGTRLRPLTFTGNKHMLPIANKPMLLYGLEHMVHAGITEIGVVLGPINEDVKRLLGDGSRFGVRITYIDQPEPKGLAHAVIVSENFLGNDSFVMYLGDNMLRQGAQPMLRIFRESKSDCVIGIAQVKDPTRYGIVVLDETGEVKDLLEKPKEPVSNWALIGVYVFDHRILDAVKTIQPSWRGELEITDAIRKLMQDGGRVQIQKVQGWWKDTGKPEDLLEANQLVLQEMQSSIWGNVEAETSVLGNVNVGNASLIRKGTTLRGPIIIGEHCDIGPNSYVGPYTSIGNNVTIKNSEVENSILMDGVFVDCRKRITDSLIGANSKIIDAESGVPRGLKLVLGDMTYVSI
jgi:glucose-1-phosphate thymidylyltransferase